MATQEPMRSPCVLSPWQTSRAPPTRSTSAMCSGERKPAGGESNVVNETTSPPPITEVGVISTGWRGHQRIGGAATRRHSGHRDAGRCSIICSGGLEAGLDRGWPEIDAAWLRTPALPVWLRTPDLPLWLRTLGLLLWLRTPVLPVWLRTPGLPLWLRTPGLPVWLCTPGLPEGAPALSVGSGCLSPVWSSRFDARHPV